jgi:hypothetical protein
LPTLKLVSAALAAVAKATRRSVRAFPPLRPSGLPSEPFWNVLSADRLAQWADVELVCVRTRVGVFVSSRVFFLCCLEAYEVRTFLLSFFKVGTKVLAVN